MQVIDEQLHIDLETMGVRPSSQILSIGAVFGDDEFYVELDTSWYASRPADFTVDTSTQEWWMRRGGFTPTQDSLVSPMEACTTFARWVTDVTAKVSDFTVWANSPSFDCNILNHHFRTYLINQPWKFYQERDVRTIKRLSEEMRLHVRIPENPHNALQDAKNQRSVVSSVYQTLAADLERARSIPPPLTLWDDEDEGRAS